MLDVHAGLTRLAHDPAGVFLDDNVLDLRRVMKRQHDELPAVCADGLIDRQRDREPEKVQSVFAHSQRNSYGIFGPS
jgi:hypothetical protein